LRYPRLWRFTFFVGEGLVDDFDLSWLGNYALYAFMCLKRSPPSCFSYFEYFIMSAESTTRLIMAREIMPTPPKKEHFSFGFLLSNRPRLVFFGFRGRFFMYAGCPCCAFIYSAVPFANSGPLEHLPNKRKSCILFGAPCPPAASPDQSSLLANFVGRSYSWLLPRPFCCFCQPKFERNA